MGDTRTCTSNLTYAKSRVRCGTTRGTAPGTTHYDYRTKGFCNFPRTETLLPGSLFPGDRSLGNLLCVSCYLPWNEPERNHRSGVPYKYVNSDPPDENEPRYRTTIVTFL